MGYQLLWLVPVTLRIAVAGVIAPYAIKKIAIEGSITKRLTIQFTLCALAATMLAAGYGVLTINVQVAIVASIGFVNSLGAFAQWKAYNLNLSKASVFTYGDDVLAMVLAFYILHEGVHVTTLVFFGIAMALIAALALTIRGRKENEKVTLRLLGWVATYSVIWGFAMFGQKWFAVNEMPAFSFLFGWYVGAAVGAWLLFATMRGERKDGVEITTEDFSAGIILTVIIMANLAVSFWAYQITPMVVAQPLFMISRMLLPILLGLWVFKEIERLGIRETWWYGLAVAGGISIALGHII